jgi:hypothetical protein
MSQNARRLLLHGDLAELERLAVWLEDWATRDLSADLSLPFKFASKRRSPT